MYTFHACIAHYCEDLEWTKKLSIPYTVISNKGITPDTPPNKGREASAYLKFIIDNYDKMPEYVFFVHGHETSWHQIGKMQDIINNLVCDIIIGEVVDLKYKNLNRFGTEPVIKFPMDFAKFLKDFVPIFNSISEHKMVVDENYKYNSCAQFCVHKDNILFHPKSMYEKFYKYLMETDELDYWTSRYFEYTWRFLFRGTYGIQGTCGSPVRPLP